MKVKTLLVDDHPIILDGYKNILKSFNHKDLDLIIETASDCDDAYLKITKSNSNYPYDIIFLDISLPPSKHYPIYSGEDLGLKVREFLPNCKLVILTMYTENLRLFNIMKNLKPEGLLIKSDVTPKEFFTAFEKILGGDLYYSQTVNEFVRKYFSQDFIIDAMDRKILFQLSKGVKTKDLSKIVDLSLAAIEKRKRNMREILEIEEGGDLALIDKAKEMGFL